MFCPHVPVLFLIDFSADVKKTRFIGAICGLGCDEETGESLLPDHDIELSFDVVLTPKDVSDVGQTYFP